MLSDQLLRFIKIALKLSKVRITVAVAFTTLTGYVLGKGSFDMGWLVVTLGIFLLACGSSVINHLQEYRYDSEMDRTKKRPLPSGEISPKQALILALSEIVAGSLILFFFVNLQAFILGLIALVWYNLIYTPLKRITPHAVIPGSVIGSIPPLAGWVASGADLSDIRAWAVALFFFIWQVPHFYLLVMKYGPQYESAGFPALTRRYTEKNMKILIFMWIISTAFAGLLLYYFDAISSQISVILVMMASVWLIVVFLLPILKPEMEFKPFRYFMRINYYVLFVILILNFDHVFLKYFF